MSKEKPNRRAADNRSQSGKLSHYDAAGRATMVDVSAKAASRREAEASAFVEMSAEVLKALPQNPKGNPLEVARFAGISAAKRTSDLIPMCHPLPLSFIGDHRGVREWRSGLLQSRHNSPDRSGDGSADGGHRRRANGI